MSESSEIETGGRREAIFARIREALRAIAPEPFAHGCGTGRAARAPLPAGMTPASDEARAWLPHVGETPSEWRVALERNLAGLRADFVALSDPADLAVQLARIAADERWTSVAAMRSDPSVAEAAVALGLPVVWGDEPYDVSAMEAASAGITRCDALVAQTGTVVLTSPTGGGRVLSVLPPHHLVVAKADEIVRDLPAAFELLQARYGERWPGMVTFISGPSRTGDIERILVLGAHGPKQLTVLLS
jgi:L-lactate dehydrogenase complex protein LldG